MRNSDRETLLKQMAMITASWFSLEEGVELMSSIVCFANPTTPGSAVLPHQRDDDSSLLSPGA